MGPKKTTSEYIVQLGPRPRELEDFEVRDEQVAKVSVYSFSQRRRMDSSDLMVMIDLSRDAMIGLGVSLIRAAHELDEGGSDLWELQPVHSSLVSSDLGVYLHPESTRVLVEAADFGTIEKVLKDTES